MILNNHMKTKSCLILLLLALKLNAMPPDGIPAIYIEKKVDSKELFAAREIRKYVYQRTGELLPIVQWDGNTKIKGDAFIVGSLAEKLELGGVIQPTKIDDDEFVIKTIEDRSGKKLIFYGGSGIGTLYAAYRFAETMGIGFYLDGDVIPDKQIPFIFPILDIKQKPLFSLRGILPFHDFPEGPDWWSIDDYKAIIAQLPKLGMNFIGFHTYPEGGVGPEPMVWIGPPWNIESDGRVKSSYPSSHFTTFDGDTGGWGYEPMPTGDYAFGASQIFEKDNFGADYMVGLESGKKSFNQQNDLFNRFGLFLKDAFTFAQEAGVKTCIGTEAPLTIPEAVKNHFKALGKNPNDTAVKKLVYEGIFARIKAAHPLDYYWIWTPENYMTEFPDEGIDATVKDLKIAVEAARAVDAPFSLATCGWTIGPPTDPTLFDKVLPKDVGISCISLIGGKEPIQFGFANIEDRPKWAIPWLEDDSRMIVPQLWAGRMRKDAADALAYKCTGLMGIHWRTRIMGPNVSALAKAGWDQSGWNPDFPDHVKVIDHTKDSLRDLSVTDFYNDWANTNFGEEAADEIASIFVKIDGVTTNKDRKDKLPKPAFWEWGPGGIRADDRPWDVVSKEYLFVKEMEDLHVRIKGQGNLERFEYWLNQFRYTREMGHFNCVWGQYKKELKKVAETKDLGEQRRLTISNALPYRIEMVDIMEDIQNYLSLTISNFGELGVLCNWQQHIFPKVFREPGLVLEKYMGSALPENAKLKKEYSGAPNIIVTTSRGSLEEGESLKFKIRTISSENAKPVNQKVYWKKPGEHSFQSKNLEHLARGVYQLKLNAQEISLEGLEYYVEIKFENGDIKRFPASAPVINQYVTIMP